MKLKSLGLIVAGTSLALLSNGCVSMLAKMAISMATTKTNDLSLCALQTRYVTNLFPKDAHTFDMAMYTSQWTEGAGLVMVSCLSRNGSGLHEIEGAVLVDGQPMEYVAGGSYSKVLPAGDTKPRTITITTTSGQKTSFTVAPTKPVELVAVNGKKGDSEVNVSKDMTLEFANVGADAGYVRVGLITDTLGMRNFSDIGVYKLDKKIKIPAIAFRHPALFQTAGANFNGKRTTSLSTNTKLVTGSNYIFVERYETTPIKAEGAAAVENFGLAWSWMPVTVKGSSETIPGVAVANTIDTSSGGAEYFSTKPASATGKPLAKAKKFALVSMSVNGNLEVITDATKYNMGSGTVTTNTAGQDEHVYHAWKFPQLPTQHWDSEMERFYSEFTTVFEKDFGISFIPTEDVLNAPAYKEFKAFEEVNSDQKIAHSFRGLKQFAGARVGTATISSDRNEIQLMRELGVDGLVVVNLALDLPTDKVTREDCNGLVSLPKGSGLSTSVVCRLGEARLQTKATFRIVGMPKAYGPLLTTYADGDLFTVKAIPYTMDEFKDAAALGRVVRSQDLVNALKTALREQESKANELGYDDVWATSPQSSGPGT